jgi:2-polyprenyl-3-methyl-5-hydroxy-6-metoxy-1,4-benzoquinol methylase
MNKEFIKKLIDPISRSNLVLTNAEYDDNGFVKTGNLESITENNIYYIIDYIPRFVQLNNYADSFGMQWNKFSHTQLDSFTGTKISEDRFYLATNWNSNELKDKWILDVGCGAGRFAEVALKAGAYVVALDYSSAVTACYNNLKHYEKLLVVQGDIYELPFEYESFDFVYSLGVLQHTPNVYQAFLALPQMLKLNGKFCVDFYEKSWKSIFLPKYWLRPITKRISKIKLFTFLEKAVPYLFEISELLNKTPFIGQYLKRIVPVANWSSTLPLTKIQLKDWALLDTFDWLSPDFDNPQSKNTLIKWMTDADFKNVEVLKAGHLVARGVKKN